MTTPDDRLKALFAADLPPARDPAFQAEVLAGLARRRFALDLARLSGACGLGALALGVLWPALSPTLADLGHSLAPAAMGVVLAGSVVVLLGGRDLGTAS